MRDFEVLTVKASKPNPAGHFVTHVTNVNGEWFEVPFKYRNLNTIKLMNKHKMDPLRPYGPDQPKGARV